MVHSSDGSECPPHVQLHDELAVMPVEDARADAGDKEDPELLQMRVAVQSVQHLLRGYEDIQRVGEPGDGGAGVRFA
jgi:hypothetical protein